MRTLNKQNQHEININIDSLPEWANYIAMDEDGDWYAYEEEPTIRKKDKYWSIGRYAVRLSLSHKEGDWKESLFKIEKSENPKGFDKIIKTQYDSSFNTVVYIPEEYIVQRLCDGIGVEIHRAIKEGLIKVEKEGDVSTLRVRVVQE